MSGKIQDFKLSLLIFFYVVHLYWEREKQAELEEVTGTIPEDDYFFEDQFIVLWVGKGAVLSLCCLLDSGRKPTELEEVTGTIPKDD